MKHELLNCKPSFCYITPISLLHYATTSRTHLVLAHLVDESEEYANFYQALSRNDHFIIMDNSAYELKEPYSPDKLIALGYKCGAHAIVLPDYPFKSSQVTIDAAEQFIPQFKEHGFLTFFVPQSEKGDLNDWIHAYAWAADNKDIDIIGMSILGVPNALPEVDPSFARVVMTVLLQQRGFFAYNKHHHYLGINSAPKTEIPSLIRLNALNTIDSSNPVWTAILGHQYSINTDSFLAVKKPKMPVDFHIGKPKDLETQARIQHNIMLTESLFTGRHVDEVWYAQE